MMFEGSEIQNDGQLSCSTTSKYYETVVPACKYRGLAYGFFIGKQAVVLAEVCYQLDLLQPTFLHYAAGDRSTILEHQSTQNVANLTTGSVEVLIDDSNLEVEYAELSSFEILCFSPRIFLQDAIFIGSSARINS